MKKLQYTVWCATVILLLPAGCVKDKLHDTPHPRHGALVVTIDRADAPDGSVAAASHVVRVDNGTATRAENLSYCYPELLTPGEHTVLVHDTPAGITVDGTVATVDAAADGTIVPLPGYLMACSETVAVAADDTTRLTARLSCRVCDVELRLAVNADDWQQVASLTARLDGVAASTDLVTGAPLGDARAVLPTVEITTPERQRSATVTAHLRCRLAGVSTASAQTLAVTITRLDGSLETIISDLTPYLRGINTDHAPVTLDSVLEFTPGTGTTAEIIGSIRPWTEVRGEDAEAK